MGLLNYIPIIGDLINKGHDLASQAITDKDKLNEMQKVLLELQEKTKESIYLAELGTKTIPWIDGLHKMGRQILNLLTIVAVVVLLLNGTSITPEVALILGGPNAIYQFVKGKGK
ncbi:MAG: hypothetical protein ACTSWQ_02390 [Candidatus Thorarchaeota archaeon]